MRRRVLFATLGAIIVGSGVFAAVGLGGDNPKAARVGQPVEKRIERVSPAAAQAAGAATRARPRARKVRLKYFQATTPTAVPASGGSAITVLTCPAGQKVVSGFYQTDRLIGADHFRAAPTNGWEFGFFDVSGIDGAAVEGIVCAKGVR